MKRFYSLIRFFIILGITVLAVELCAAVIIHSITGMGFSSGRSAGNNEKQGNLHAGSTGKPDQGGNDTNTAGGTENEGTLSLDQNAEENASQNSAGDTYLSGQEVMALGEASLGDKITCMGILAKVSREDLKAITDMLRSGVTYPENEQIREILRQYLSDEELQKLMELLDKNKKKLAGRGSSR